MNHDHTAAKSATTVYLDLTHLGRHVTGLERIAIDLFEKAAFEMATIKPVRATGIVSMIVKQQIVLPWLALTNRQAEFVFPGFPPSPLFRFARHRTTLYVHDLFLVTRRQDLGLKARLYMARPFRYAVTGLKRFLVNSEKTRAELQPFVAADAAIGLYRPEVRNVFDLSPNRDSDSGTPETKPLRLVSVGTVEPRKNYRAAALIVEHANRLHPGGAELHIVGREGWGPDAAFLSAHPLVTIHGYLAASEAKQVLESADVYLCTSHDEGLGLPLIEAQYAGLPVVAPDQAVFREVLGVSGTFINPAAPEAAARTILDLIGKPDWRPSARAASLSNTQRWNRLASADRDRVKGMFAESGQTDIAASQRSLGQRA
jgi:glycosyltransferase involved in cell wall biosynthesis